MNKEIQFEKREFWQYFDFLGLIRNRNSIPI